MPRGGREHAQRKRAEARERRRQQAPEEPNGRADAAPGDGDSPIEEPLGAVKQAAKVAAAGAAVGAAAAAARALSKHDEDEAEEDGKEEEKTSAEPEEPRAQEPEEEPEPQPEEGQPLAEQPQTQEEPVPGAAPDEARTVVRKAREQLEALLGREAESVSAMERTHDGWLVTLEVVEVSRIPESTDVLASYEVELDESCNLRRYARVRRYNRTQADDGGRP